MKKRLEVPSFSKIGMFVDCSRQKTYPCYAIQYIWPARLFFATFLANLVVGASDPYGHIKDLGRPYIHPWRAKTLSQLDLTSGFSRFYIILSG